PALESDHQGDPAQHRRGGGAGPRGSGARSPAERLDNRCYRRDLVRPGHPGVAVLVPHPACDHQRAGDLSGRHLLPGGKGDTPRGHQRRLVLAALLGEARSFGRPADRVGGRARSEPLPGHPSSRGDPEPHLPGPRGPDARPAGWLGHHHHPRPATRDPGAAPCRGPIDRRRVRTGEEGPDGRSELMPHMQDDFPLLLSTLYQQSVDIYPNQEVVSVGSDRRIERATYAETDERIRRLAAAVAERLEVPVGGAVGTFACNLLRHHELYWALANTGRICHTINIRLFPDQVTYIVDLAADQAVFVAPDLVPLLAPTADSFDSV